jgi:LuxR family maltose regulon positive regulatory protein
MSRALALVDPSEESRKSASADIAGLTRPLLETKLYVPRSRSKLVGRPRLAAALSTRNAHRLTVVSAPAGFGKSTLLTEWVATVGEENVAWVSLDPGDNDPWLFWAYVTSALQKTRIAPSRAIRQVSVEAVVATLINEIAAADTDCVLVLDDYHVIDERTVHDTMTLFIDRLPPRMHVVIASRSTPPVGLARLRARDELLELRAEDLRFTAEETSAFFRQVMALDLTTADVSALEQRTEGWIAGLKLAALSMKGRADVAQCVERFSGANRHVADYLVDEVVQAEPEHVRRFLLATASLTRLSGPLCDAVTGDSGSQALLEELERRNLFVIPLDDQREWFRYHHLFAEVLQKQSIAADRDRVHAAHTRASEWFEQHGATSDAIHHAVAAGDAARAARLLEHNWPEKDRSYESAKWLARVKTLPEEIVRTRPVLAMGYAWGLLNSGELEAAELRLCDVERALETDFSHFLISDQARFQSLGTELAAARIYLAQSRGDIPGTLEHATRTLATIPADDHAARATGIALVALAHWGRGELTAAHDTFARALEAMRAAGHDLDVVRGLFVLGDVRAAQGRLRDAAECYHRGLAVADQLSRFAEAETSELYLGLSELHREWNDLSAAEAHLETVKRRESTAVHKGNAQRWCVAMARIHEARGETDAALASLAEAETHERRDPLPRPRPIPAIGARLQLARGNIEAAEHWARASAVTIDGELSYLREFDHLTLARLLITRRHAQGELLSFLERLQVAAQSGGRLGSVIEILVLQSLANQAFGNSRASLDALAEALTLAERESFLRVFLDEGQQVRDLLRTATSRGLAGAYTRHVLRAFEAPRQAAPPAPRSAPSAKSDRLAQPVTSRELEILRLIAGGLRNAEIADHLSISPATVKRHIANLYGKLGAEHRTEALVRAAELELL